MKPTVHDILIKNGRVWDGERFCNSDILIDDGKIAGIAPKAEKDARYIYDAEGKTVLPGIVDVHTHLRGFSSECIGAQAEAVCFPFGVTAAADTEACFGDKYLSDLSLVKNVFFVGIRVRDNKPDWENLNDRLEKLGDKVAGIKVFYDLGSYSGWNSDLFREVCGFAAEKGLRVMVHTANSPSPMIDIVKTLKKGDILTHAFHGRINSAKDDGFLCIKEAKRKGVIIDLGFEGTVHTDFNVFKNAVRCGVKPDIIGTDITWVSAYTLGGKYGMTMVMSVAKSMGMSEEEIFKAVTSSAAAALGKENEWGYIKEGRCADIAVIDLKDEGFDLTDSFGNNIKSDVGYRCELTVVNGQVIYRR